MRQSLFNIARMVTDSGKDASPEASFLSDFDYVCKKLNSHEPHYYFKKLKRDKDVEYFDVTEHSYPVACVFELPEPSEDVLFDKTHVIYHTNEQEYYICLYSSGKPSNRYKPSSMHCMRNMYFQATEQDLDKSDKTSDTYGILESGTDRHERIQFVVSKMQDFGVDCEFVDVAQYVTDNNLPLEVVEKKGFETKLYDAKRNIIFLCDGVVKYKGVYYILEIKTESQYKWNGRRSVDNFHKYQAWTYSLELGIEDVIFIYENRDVCSKKPFMLHVTDGDRKFIEDRVSMCTQYVNDKKVPPKEENVTGKVCNYCDYKTICKACGD